MRAIDARFGIYSVAPRQLDGAADGLTLVLARPAHAASSFKTKSMKMRPRGTSALTGQTNQMSPRIGRVLDEHPLQWAGAEILGHEIVRRLVKSEASPCRTGQCLAVIQHQDLIVVIARTT